FSNKQFSSKQTSAIQKAEYLLDVNNWTQEERKMIEVWNHRAASYYANMQEQFDDGFEQGIEKGIEQGIEQKTQEVLNSLLQVGISDENIALVMKMPIEKVRELRKSLVSEEGIEYGV
ncbi:hypothetical protein K6V76_10205, partial [Streptococcus suis]|nr:hypothetical protein [Streptococcus suis]